MSAIHPQDQLRIEQLHGAASADIEERMIKLQDASYELGRQRGLAEGKAQRAELLEALKQAVAWIEGESTPVNALANARASIAKATGSEA